MSGLMEVTSSPLPVCSLAVCVSFVTRFICHLPIYLLSHLCTHTVRCLLWIKDHTKYQDAGTSLLLESTSATCCRASSGTKKEGVTQGSHALRLSPRALEFCPFTSSLWASAFGCLQSLSPSLILYFLLSLFPLSH